MSLLDRVLFEARGGDIKVRTLYLFDMDDTLIRQPKKDRGQADYERLTGRKWPFERWWSVPQSLESPLAVSAKPEVKAAYQRAIQDTNGFVIIMTGRLHTKRMLKAVQSALHRAGYPKHTPGDNLFLKNPAIRDTAGWKKRMIRGFVKRFPSTKSIHMWDDRGEHVQQFKQQIKDLGRIPHVVHVQEGLMSLFDRLGLNEARESCLSCVRKHLAQAFVLANESQQEYPSHRWIAIGHLGEAGDEAAGDFPTLAQEIRRHRIKYMADPEHVVPFLTLIEKATALSEDTDQIPSAQQKKLIDFVKRSPGLDDDDYHAFAEKLGLEPHEAEEVIYAHVRKTSKNEGEEIPGGMARKSKPSDFDPKELAMGIKVEKEHLVGGGYSKDEMKAKAREISMDHLTEIPGHAMLGYYSGLNLLEKFLKSLPGDPNAKQRVEAFRRIANGRM